MKIEFRFNGTSQLLLIPETSKDTQLLNMFIGEHKTFKLMPSTGDTAIITTTADVIVEGDIVAARQDLSQLSQSYHRKP
jgi:hypothetical protein